MTTEDEINTKLVVFLISLKLHAKLVFCAVYVGFFIQCVKIICLYQIHRQRFTEFFFFFFSIQK